MSCSAPYGREEPTETSFLGPLTYLDWNDALASSIFRPEMAGREVFMFVNDELITELGGAGSIADFVAAVEQGPPWVDSRLGLCQRAVHALEGWRDRGLRYPPYIGYLGLFVLAVGVEGGFAAHAYYPRLKTLLGWEEIDSGALPSFDKMLRLWDDLEVWSNHDSEGTLGVFNIRIAGEWIHVGLPKAQAVLTEHERKALPELFLAAGFDPMAPPSDELLAEALRRHGVQLLRARTLALLGNRSSDANLFMVLLDTVRGELEEWDGEAASADEAGDYSVNALLRICLRLDAVSGRVAATLRVASRSDFPEDALLLDSSDPPLRLTCQEYMPGWSSPLRDADTGIAADASALDWSSPLVLADHAAGWRARLPGSRVRIFVSGLSSDLPGLVEVRGLPGGRPFVLAANTGVLPALDAWRDSGQVNLERVSVAEGLPRGWTLFQSSGAAADGAIRRALPELSLPAGIRVRLQGGIRSGHGNTYFQFAVPSIRVDGAYGDEEVACNGRPMDPVCDGSSTFVLPRNLPLGTKLTVEVGRDGEVLRRQSLFLSAEFAWKLESPLLVADRFGSVREPDVFEEEEVRGAIGGALQPQALPVRPDVWNGRRVFLIGRRPGEIATSPDQPAMDGWEPVWLVELERHGRAEYCGLDLSNSCPLQEDAGTPELRELWKDVLWQRRKRIVPPRRPALRTLWKEYIQAAAHV